jgi:hypothetical protein
MEENPQTYAGMLNMAQQSEPAPNVMQQPGINSVVDPNASAPLAMMQRPVQSPAELEARKSGWQMAAEKLSDPNLLRALGFAGAAMAMPGGSVGHGLATGMTAFQAGEYADIAKKREDEKFALEQRQAGATYESTQAGTGATLAQTDLAKARLPGAQAQSGVEVATADSRIAQAKAESQKAVIAAKAAQRVEDLAPLEESIRERRLLIERQIPDETVRRQILAEVEKAEIAVQQAKQTLAKGKTEGAIGDITLDVLKGMSKEDQAAFLTKSGKFASSAAGSGIAQQASMWGAIYDKLPETDPHKKGKTREQFQMTQLQSTKAKDITDMMKNYVLAGGDDPAIIAQFSDILKGQLGARQGGEPAPGGGSKETPWQDAGPGMQFRVRADGTREVRRKPNTSSKEFEGSSNMP